MHAFHTNWGGGSHPTGTKRHEDQKWAQMIQSQVYPRHSDIDWDEYVVWVENGGGDEWFRQDDPSSEDEDTFREIRREEEEILPGYYDAQTRLRTSYACKDLVRPLSTPLDERIVALAYINGER